MSVFLWWAIPVLATAGALVYASRRTRMATPEEQQRGVAEMERFRAAMQRPLPPKRDH